MVIEKDLGGFFKWVIDGELVIVDPRFIEEYKLILKENITNLSK